MNKLTQTVAGTTAINLMPSLKNLLNPTVLDKYVIPDTFYDVYYKTLQSKKYPLLRPTIKMAKEGKIKLFNTADPISGSNKLIDLPPYFSGFVFKDTKGDYISYVNATAKSGYHRNKAGEAIGNSLDENATYAYLQTGATSRILAMHDKELTNNTKFVSTCADIYSNLIDICIDGMYPIGGDTDKYIILTFLTIMFFFQMHAGYTVEQALPLALKIKTVDPMIIKNECLAYSDNKLEMKNITDYFKTLEYEFNFIKKGSINLRALEMAVISRYGQPAFFMIEHFQSFLNLVQNVNLMSRIYKDNYLRKLIKPTDIQSINQTLLVASGD